MPASRSGLQPTPALPCAARAAPRPALHAGPTGQHRIFRDGRSRRRSPGHLPARPPLPAVAGQAISRGAGRRLGAELKREGGKKGGEKKKEERKGAGRRPLAVRQGKGPPAPQLSSTPGSPSPRRRPGRAGCGTRRPRRGASGMRAGRPGLRCPRRRVARARALPAVTSSPPPLSSVPFPTLAMFPLRRPPLRDERGRRAPSRSPPPSPRLSLFPAAPAPPCPAPPPPPAARRLSRPSGPRGAALASSSPTATQLRCPRPLVCIAGPAPGNVPVPAAARRCSALPREAGGQRRPWRRGPSTASLAAARSDGVLQRSSDGAQSRCSCRRPRQRACSVLVPGHAGRRLPQ